MYLEYFDKTPVIRLWLANQVLVQCTASPASHPHFINVGLLFTHII